VAEAHVFYELPRSTREHAKAGTLATPTTKIGATETDRAIVEGRPFQGHVEPKETGFSSRGYEPGPWDTFSTRNLALRVNHRMAQEFSGESDRIRQASVAAVSRALAVDPTLWSPAERPAAQRALENWSLVLALIPSLRRWSPQEKRDALEIIRAQAGRNEMRYLRLTQHLPRLRQELLRLGSKR
jgi:hypothetical protein